MNQNAPGESPKGKGANRVLRNLLILNWVCLVLGTFLFGLAYLGTISYQREYRYWEFEHEKNVREWIVSRLVQENGLKECPVKHAAFCCTHFNAGFVNVATMILSDGMPTSSAILNTFSANAGL